MGYLNNSYVMMPSQCSEPMYHLRFILFFKCSFTYFRFRNVLHGSVIKFCNSFLLKRLAEVYCVTSDSDVLFISIYHNLLVPFGYWISIQSRLAGIILLIRMVC